MYQNSAATSAARSPQSRRGAADAGARIVTSTCATMRRRSAARQRKVGELHPIPRSRNRPEIPSTILQTAPSQRRISGAAAAPENHPGGDCDHETAVPATGEKPLTFGGASRAIRRDRPQGTFARQPRGAIGIFGTLSGWLSSPMACLALPLIVVQGYLSLPVHVVHENQPTRQRFGAARSIRTRSSVFIRRSTAYEYIACSTGTIIATRRSGSGSGAVVGPSPPRIRNSQSPIPVTAVALRLAMFRHALRQRLCSLDSGRQRHIVGEKRVSSRLLCRAAARSLAIQTGLLPGSGSFRDRRPVFLRPYFYAEHTGCERTRSASEHPHHLHRHAHENGLGNMPYQSRHNVSPHDIPRLSCPATKPTNTDRR